VAVLRALLILSAVSALATLPCLIALMISIGPRAGGAKRSPRSGDPDSEPAPRRGYRVLRWVAWRLRRRPRIDDPSLTARQRRRLARLDRCFGPEPAPTVSPDTVPIERVAADLRRLRRQRAGIAQRSPVWRSAIEDAYDDRLRLACLRLGIEEHLAELTGVDREIERVRLEGELQAAGIAISGYEAAAQ
jgi:hypothetical protein